MRSFQIACGALMLLSVLPTDIAHACSDVNLVLALDASKSVSKDQWELQTRGYQAAFNDTEVIERIMEGRCRSIYITVIRWSDISQQIQEVPWTHIDDEQSARAFGTILGSLPYNSLSMTSIVSAMQMGRMLLEEAPDAAERLIVDISGDGYDDSQAAGYLPVECQAMVRKGITVNGLPIMTDEEPGRYEHDHQGNVEVVPIDLYYKKHVICGPGSFVEPAWGFEDFARAVKRKLSRELTAMK